MSNYRDDEGSTNFRDGNKNFHAISDDSVSTLRRRGTVGLDVLLLYEDFSTGLRARQTLTQVAEALDLPMDFQVELWRLDLLREPILLAQAAAEAARADIVLLSEHGRSDVPAVLDSFLRKWVANRGGKPSALVVSLDTEARGGSIANRTIETLRAIAEPAGAEVFVSAIGTTPTGLEAAMEDVQRRAKTQTVVLEDLLHRTNQQS